MLAGWLVASKVVVRSGDRGRNWPGGGRGGSPLEGIASPGVGRTRLEESQWESQWMGRPARITRATPKGCSRGKKLVGVSSEAWAVVGWKSTDETV